MTANRWVVDIKGGPDCRSFEISVLRENNEHGRRSYGWFDEDKLLISSSGGPCHDNLVPLVWRKMVALAHEVADELNAAEAAEARECPGCTCVPAAYAYGTIGTWGMDLGGLDRALLHSAGWMWIDEEVELPSKIELGHGITLHLCKRPRHPGTLPTSMPPRPPRVLGQPRLALAWAPLPRARRSTHKPAHGYGLRARIPRRQRRF